MLANVTCPACQHKYWIQEGEMGSRQICPNCQSPFFAGASVAEARPSASASASSTSAPAALQPSYAKTMIGDSAPLIKYACPRCKTPLEGEAGTKRNCPSCTQRHQVPAQSKPEPAAAAPNLNKTMLAGDESAAPPRPPIKYNCPSCKKPLEAPAEKGGTKTNCPSCQQRLQIPAAPPVAVNRNKTMLAGDESSAPANAASQGVYSADGVRGAGPLAAGPAPPVGPWAALLTPKNVALGVVLGFVMLLILLIVPALIRGGAKDVDQNALAQRQLELEKLKMELEAKKAEMDRQAKAAADAQRQLDENTRRSREEEDRRREQERQRLRDAEDEDARARLKRKFDQEKQQREREREELDRRSKEMLAEAQRKLEDTKKSLDAAQQKQTTIIQQPAPVITYPPYNPYYYRPGWWGW
jgi:DNA-directed RNA polymerase subunit RPC12/RpoP